MDKATQLAVIGAGPGGYAAAFMAADLNLEVTLIDPEADPGGVCLYRGCIPSKALLHVARIIAESRQAANWGITFSEPKINLDKLRDWKDGVVKKLTSGLGQLTRLRSVNYIKGRAQFVDGRTLTIDTGGSASEQLRFEHAIVATGSRPSVVPGLSFDGKRVWDSTAALELAEIPKNILVLGGGYIGLELGTVYAALGSRVTVIEMTSGLLPGVDRDLVAVLTKQAEKIFDNILLETKVVGLEDEGDGVRVTFQKADGGQDSAMFDRVLAAVGRRPNSAGLGLENTAVEIDSRGFIKVDSQRRTAERTIFAIGDAAGEPMLAHKATHEGIVAAEVIAGRDVAFEPRAIPAVVFTDPEIAWCGLTESQARAAGRDVKVARFPWTASGRAATLDRGEGVTKLIVDPETERILGVGIAGVGAGELIAEGVLAVEMAALVSDLKLSIHAHPTLSETTMEAAEMFFGRSTHLYRQTKRKRQSQ